MMQSKKVLAAALLTSLGLVAATLMTPPFASAAEAANGLIASRIDAAFAAAAEVKGDPSLARVATLAHKGDLPASAGCNAQTWPEVASNCLIMSDGTAVRSARFVTVGHRTGEASSVLARMPVPQVATR